MFRLHAVQFRVEPGALTLPLMLPRICAGFPSPADDHLEPEIDLVSLLLPNRPATFLWKVEGASMREAGIFDGDLIVVDRSLMPKDGDVVVAIVNGERSLKRLHLPNGRARLSFENDEFPSYELPEGGEVEIWGVVRCNLHWFRGRP